MKQKIKTLYAQLFWKLDRKLFPITQKIGFHITKTHFYSPIPTTDELPDSLWKNEYDMSIINMDDKALVKLLSLFSKQYKSEYKTFPLQKSTISNDSSYYINNGLFESVDAEVLYSMIRHFKPKKIFEIGSGFSTLVSSLAIKKNLTENHKTRFDAFEPYPSAVLQRGIEGLSKLHVIKAQKIPLKKFQELEANDILFIDSSHILKTGSDVQYEYLRVLPTLKKGVIVHIHDIFLPQDYPKKWIIDYHRFSTEQYILYAFLTFNSKFKVLWGSRYMHIKHPGKLSKAFYSYNPKTSTPESFWIQKTA